MIDVLKQEYGLGSKRSEKPQFYIIRLDVAYHANSVNIKKDWSVEIG
ncbi:MAG: hypothetical protein ACFFDI_29440 [Promethearchaeota archaeon]